MPKNIIIATRGSKLALAQAHEIRNKLIQDHPVLSITLKIIKTKGDQIQDTPLVKIGGKGLFVKEIEKALLEGEASIAVHSMKDMPAQIPEGLCIGAVPLREDVRDVLICKNAKGFQQLPAGACIGTGSLRRSSQILNSRPDLKIVPLRGNLDTRLYKLGHSNMDAIIVAAAGVHRLGLHEHITEYLEPDLMLPAVAQGALCLQIRKDDPAVAALIKPLEDPATRFAVTGERRLLQRLEGGCQVPIAGLGHIQKDKITIRGLVADWDGKNIIRAVCSGPVKDCEKIGLDLANLLLKQGAGNILNQLKS